MTPYARWKMADGGISRHNGDADQYGPHFRFCRCVCHRRAPAGLRRGPSGHGQTFCNAACQRPGLRANRGACLQVDLGADIGHHFRHRRPGFGIRILKHDRDPTTLRLVASADHARGVFG